MNISFLIAEEYDAVRDKTKSATSFFFSQEYRNYLQKHQNQLLEERKLMQTSAVSPNKHFRIHFDTVGKHAVANVDLNQNGIPDYIDTVCEVFDYVYEVQVEKMGFNPPRTDLYESDCTLYDIYVKDQVFDEEAYGYTTPLKMYGDGNVFKKWFSNITIDNNYSELDSVVFNSKKYPLFATTGLDGLKATAAHEFFHAIQFAYGDDIKNGINTWSVYEMNSVCMEILVYPEVEDYLVYVNSLFKDLSEYVFSNTDPKNGYRYGIFFYMLCQKYGENFLLKFWQNVEKGNTCFEALEDLLVSSGSSLADEWMDFCKWIYYTGSRAIPDKYFSFANKCKDIKPTKTVEFNDGSWLQTEEILPYELRYIRVILLPTNGILKTADTADYIITNLNTEATIKQMPEYITYSFLLSDVYESNYTEIIEDKCWYNLYSPSSFLEHLSFIYRGSETYQIENAYPQPFDKNRDKELCFPVPDYLKLGNKVLLTILNMELKEVVSQELQVTLESKNRVVVYQPADLEDGIYIYQINVGGVSEKIGKLLIKTN